MSRQNSRLRAGVTLRAITIGLLLIPINAYWITKSEVVLATTHATTLSIFFNTICILFLFSLLNLALKRLVPSLAFTPGELLTIYTILCIATSLLGWDMMQILLPVMNYGFWFATPENGWEELFWGHLPSWLVMSDNNIARGYYEGETSFYDPDIVLAWLKPALFWTGFILVLYFTMICVVTIIRKRWMEEEKLSYPIIQLPMEMAVNSARFYKNKMMWLGFAIAAGLDMIHGLHQFYSFIPDFNTRYNLAPLFTEKPWNAIGWMPVCFYPFVIGLSYFMPLDLSFSTWFFYLFWKAQLVARSALGLKGISGPYLGDQSAGAWLGIGLLSIWLSRHSIFRIIRSALSRKALNDSGEPLPYRMALGGIVIGIGVLCLFSRAAGMSLWVGVSFFGLYFIIVLAATRMRAELGPPTHDLYYEGPERMITAAVGTRVLGPGNLSVFTLYFWITRDFRSHPMPHQLEGFKLAEKADFSNRKLVGAMMLATLVGTIAAFWSILHLYYEYGVTSRVHGYSLGVARETYVRLQNWLDYPSGPDKTILGQMGFGLGFTIILMSLRRMFLGFPFHPVGYGGGGKLDYELDVVFRHVKLADKIHTSAKRRSQDIQAWSPVFPRFDAWAVHQRRYMESGGDNCGQTCV